MPVKRPERGFSLLELIVGLVVFAVAMTLLTSVLFPLFSRGTEPVFQARAAELGQALMEEISGRAYDETTPVGGLPPCAPCSSTLGADGGEGRADFDDVDDYHDYCAAAPVAVENAAGAVPVGFDNYGMRICVSYDGNYDGVADSDESAKLITVDIFPPKAGQPATALSDEAIRFRLWRSNY